LYRAEPAALYAKRGVGCRSEKDKASENQECEPHFHGFRGGASFCVDSNLTPKEVPSLYRTIHVYEHLPDDDGLIVERIARAEHERQLSSTGVSSEFLEERTFRG